MEIPKFIRYAKFWREYCVTCRWWDDEEGCTYELRGDDLPDPDCMRHEEA